MFFMNKKYTQTNSLRPHFPKPALAVEVIMHLLHSFRLLSKTLSVKIFESNLNAPQNLHTNLCTLFQLCTSTWKWTLPGFSVTHCLTIAVDCQIRDHINLMDGCDNHEIFFSCSLFPGFASTCLGSMWCPSLRVSSGWRLFVRWTFRYSSCQHHHPSSQTRNHWLLQVSS